MKIFYTSSSLTSEAKVEDVERARIKRGLLGLVLNDTFYLTNNLCNLISYFRNLTSKPSKLFKLIMSRNKKLTMVVNAIFLIFILFYRISSFTGFLLDYFTNN